MQIWPPVVDPATLTRQVWDVATARKIPGVGRALGLYSGLISQCALDEVRGEELIRPRLPMLQDPDPSRSRPNFVRVQVEDYLLHGNAVHKVIARLADGQVRAVKWFPAHMWSIVDPATTETGSPEYYLNGRLVARDDVVHVQRGAMEGAPWRGVGVIEEHLKTLNRAGLQEASESENLSGGGVPSVAVIAPQQHVSQPELDRAATTWGEKYGGPGRKPGIFPNGTNVIPLSWSPVDNDLTQARRLTLTDLANAFNLDAYWLGGQSSSFDYKTSGQMWLALLRMSLEPVMVDLESVWTLRWIPPSGRSVRFDRLQLTRDDFATEVTTGAAAVKAGLMTAEEWRIRQGLPVVPEHGELQTAGPPAVEPGPGRLQLVPGGSDESEEA